MRTPKQWLNEYAKSGALEGPNIKFVHDIQQEAFAAGHLTGLRDAVREVAVEEELDGPIPDTVFVRLQFRSGAEEVLRAAVRSTKHNITERLTTKASEFEKESGK